MKIMFVCHGNICRSPMAEFIFKDMLKRKGLENKFTVASSATSTEEIYCGVGNPIYPPARRILNEHGISCDGKRAVLFTKADYDKYDIILVMDNNNVRNIMRIVGADTQCKIHKLLEFCDGGDVADPWYSGDFKSCYNDIKRGCNALIDKLIKEIG